MVFLRLFRQLFLFERIPFCLFSSYLFPYYLFPSHSKPCLPLRLSSHGFLRHFSYRSLYYFPLYIFKKFRNTRYLSLLFLCFLVFNITHLRNAQASSEIHSGKDAQLKLTNDNHFKNLLKKNKKFFSFISFNANQKDGPAASDNLETFEELSIQYYRDLVCSAKNENTLLATTHTQHQRVVKILNKLIPYALKWHDRAQEWQWELVIIRSPKIDALSLPGGKIIIYTGMINRLKLRDAEIAHLLAHLSAHAIREHAREHLLPIFSHHAHQTVNDSLTKNKIQKANHRESHIVANHSSRTVSRQSVNTLFKPFSGLPHDHDDETEADIIGIDIATHAGFNSRAVINLWQKIALANRAQKNAFSKRHRYTFKRERALKTRIQINRLSHYKETLPNE